MKAKENGSTDNITVLVVFLRDDVNLTDEVPQQKDGEAVQQGGRCQKQSIRNNLTSRWGRQGGDKNRISEIGTISVAC